MTSCGRRATSTHEDGTGRGTGQAEAQPPSVTDRGAGFTLPRATRASGPTAGSGFGLRGTRERLEVLFGDDAELWTENVEAGGARVTVSLPVVTGDAAYAYRAEGGVSLGA